MCCYLMTNELIEDRMNTLYNRGQIMLTPGCKTRALFRSTKMGKIGDKKEMKSAEKLLNLIFTKLCPVDRCPLPSYVYALGSKYTTWLTDKSGFWIVEIRLGYNWSGFWKGSEIQKPNHLKSGQMDAILSKTIWNPDKNVRISNILVFEWLGL